MISIKNIRSFAFIRLSPVSLTLLLFVSLAISGALFYFGVIQQKDHLTIIKERGILVVATRNGLTTYYGGPNGPTGFEYDLAVGFAKSLGVGIQVVVADTIDEMVKLLREDKVDLIASGMPISKSSEALVRYGPIYQQVHEQVIDLQKSRPRPRKIAELSAPLSALPTANHLETISLLKESRPDLEIKIENDLDFEELLEKVSNKEIRYALANSNEMQAVQHFHPELRVAFDLPTIKGVAWAVRRSKDLSLFNQTLRYFRKVKSNGFLTQLMERYFGHVANFDYSGTQLFLGRIESRLPKYIDLFKEAGLKYQMDWKLLAAMSHQESQWKRDAKSKTGVRGLMMLTLNTAAQLGVTDRLDPRQSIMGGAKYISQLRKRLPASIKEPDRTWMAMAAYNVGYGHLTDAQEITVTLAQDPNKWVDVKKNLPLLRKKKWYKRVKNGYARGDEPVHYVQNIRRYYDILQRFDDSSRPR